MDHSVIRSRHESISDALIGGLRTLYPAASTQSPAAEIADVQWRSYRVAPIDMELWVGLTEARDAENIVAIATKIETALQAWSGTHISITDRGPQAATPCGDRVTFALSNDSNLLLVLEPGLSKSLQLLARQLGSNSEQTSRPDGVSKVGAMSALLEMELPLSICFGRTRMTLQQALDLKNGSTIEINPPRDSLVEVIVNNCVVARGEVVVVEGNYGVRIRELLSGPDRDGGLPAASLGLPTGSSGENA